MDIVDNFSGVIREVGDATVRVSLYDERREEFLTDLDRSLFVEGNVQLMRGEGFNYYVEKYDDGKEIPKVERQKTGILTEEDRKGIAKEIAETL